MHTWLFAVKLRAVRWFLRTDKLQFIKAAHHGDACNHSTVPLLLTPLPPLPPSSPPRGPCSGCLQRKCINTVAVHHLQLRSPRLHLQLRCCFALLTRNFESRKRCILNVSGGKLPRRTAVMLWYVVFIYKRCWRLIRKFYWCVVEAQVLAHVGWCVCVLYIRL